MAENTKAPEQLPKFNAQISGLEPPKIPAAKADIAKVYEISSATLCRFFNKHIEQFLAIGYEKKRKWLTPKERELLREILGDPYI